MIGSPPTLLVALLAASTFGCTARNPAFGDAADSTAGGTSSGNPLPDPTTSGGTSGADDSPQSSAESGTSRGPTDSTTADTGNHEDSTGVPLDTGGTSDTVGPGEPPVVLYATNLPTLAFAVEGDPTGAADGLCAMELRAADIGLSCSGHVAWIRGDGPPTIHPEVVALADRPVVSVEGDAIAAALGKFALGEWLIPALHEAGGGGLPQLEEFGWVATGGYAAGDANCEGWSTTESSLTIGGLTGGPGWLDIGGVGCNVEAAMLCLCLP